MTRTAKRRRVSVPLRLEPSNHEPSSSVHDCLFTRGVQRMPYLINGAPVLAAIDSRGNCIKRVRVTPDSDPALATAWLEGLLDHYDALPARPALALVPGGLC